MKTVSASVDSRSYSLTVNSAHGTPVPGTVTEYAWRSSVTCSAPSSVVEQGINWKNTGWTGTGSVPANGATNTTGNIVLTNISSFIVWNWSASEFAITNVVAVQRPGTKLVDVTYDLISDLTNAVPVGMKILNGSNALSTVSVAGDIGESTLPGNNRLITWNAGTDWNGEFSNLTFMVYYGGVPATLSGMVEIPAGSNSGTDPDFGVYSLTVTNTFYMDATEVTKEQWDAVYNWAIANGYTFDRAGSGNATNHPVHTLTWYDAVKWCNARSEKEGRTPCYTTNGAVYKTGQNTNAVCDFSAKGYRLPTVVEWQYAARGGLSGKRFPWGDTIAHSQANYNSSSSYSYDISPTRGYHPGAGTTGPRTMAVKSFAANGYGLYDMAGNVWEWCWDSSGSYRNLRGGSWGSYAFYAGCSRADWDSPTLADDDGGFRAVCRPEASSTNLLFMSSAEALTDTRNYSLTVESACGTPSPAIGTNLYAWQSVITCSVDSAVSQWPTSWTCYGWAGTGSVPLTGTTNTTGAIVLTNLNSSIIWLWPITTFSDLRAVNVTAAQRPGTKLVEVSYDLQSTATNSAAVSLAVLSGTNAVAVSTVFGDAGLAVSTGEDRVLIWDAGVDWNGNLDDLTFRILGQDAQGVSAVMPAGRVRIPAGQNTGTDPDSGAYSLSVSNSLFMDAGEVTKAQWDRVAEWAITNGYSFANAGSATDSNHPVQTVSWYDAAKWCNARSQMEGVVPCYNTNDWSCDFSANGYRLPTVQEWQYAARGGLSGKRFPWGDTITHSNDIYYSSASYSYDVSMTRGFHPLFGTGTAPAGSGSTNGYGLTEMSGNVMEWCNDLSGVNRTLAGGSWDQYASEARCAYTSLMHPSAADYNIGFRTVQRASSAASAETGSAIPVDTRDYQLVVSSAHGAPVPGIGTNLYAWRASVTCSVDSSVISGLTNWTSAGWSGSGSVSASGATPDTGSFVLTGLVSSITWNWNTNYWIEAVTTGEGQVSGGNRWALKGSDVTLSVTPSNGWLFMGWSGDATSDYTEESIILPVVRPVSITATFSDDADSDGLLNTNETALGTNPRRKDSDGDGMDDPHELIAGTAPTNSASLLGIQLQLTGSANELTWYGVSGRYYRLEYTDNLSGTWLPKGSVVSGANGQVMRLDVGAGSNRFYRIRVSDSPAGF